MQIGNQNTSHGSVNGTSVNSGVDSSKSTQSKMSHQTTRKASLDNEANRSVGRSSNGGRTGSNDRVLKLKINKSKGQRADKSTSGGQNNQKMIATIQRMRQGGS